MSVNLSQLIEGGAIEKIPPSPELIHEILSPRRELVPACQLLTSCIMRLRNFAESMRVLWVGLENEDTGHIVDWIIASLIARENVLLIGPPGCAKSEIATRTFELLGLCGPEVDMEGIQKSLQNEKGSRAWWSERETLERKKQKFFHYLLSRYTQPEELFGPVELGLLKEGVLARVNFGLLTGPGVYGAFLDEIFKASSSILNTLLTLTQERKYFNWGGMVSSDLLMFIGASNEMPGGFASGMMGAGTGAEDFQTLYAFLDRFPMRMDIPLASSDVDKEYTSDLSKAFRIALERESHKFTTGHLFDKPGNDMPSIIEVLITGRCIMQDCLNGSLLFKNKNLQSFREHFMNIGRDLMENSTPVTGDVSWTISPRKLKALYKIALAHAVLTDRSYDSFGKLISLTSTQLKVFKFIWDTPLQKNELSERVNLEVDHARL